MQDKSQNTESAIRELEAEGRRRKKSALRTSLSGLAVALLCVAVIWLELPKSELTRLLTAFGFLMSLVVVGAGLLGWCLIAWTVRVRRTLLRKGVG